MIETGLRLCLRTEQKLIFFVYSCAVLLYFFFLINGRFLQLGLTFKPGIEFRPEITGSACQTNNFWKSEFCIFCLSLQSDNPLVYKSLNQKWFLWLNQNPNHPFIGKVLNWITVLNCKTAQVGSSQKLLMKEGSNISSLQHRHIQLSLVRFSTSLQFPHEVE